MAAAGAGVAASLIIRPPKDAQAAGWRLVLGLTLLFGLAPASRVGYFVYPLGLAAWLLLLRAATSARPAGPGGQSGILTRVSGPPAQQPSGPRYQEAQPCLPGSGR